jgi:hypothetical protein
LKPKVLLGEVIIPSLETTGNIGRLFLEDRREKV